MKLTLAALVLFSFAIAAKTKILSDADLYEAKLEFKAAQTFYVDGRYRECLESLNRVHKVTTQFENSRELVSFCEQGIELVKMQKKLEVLEREHAMRHPAEAGKAPR